MSAALGEWATNNWFSLLQSLGIVFGLLFTATAIRRDAAARRASDLLSLSERHQELWSELYRRPELRRIRSKEVDLVAEPVTPAEEEFLKLVFVHFHVGWLVARRGALVPMEAVKQDVRTFFSLPIPKIIWKAVCDSTDPKFVEFVVTCVNQGERNGLNVV